MTDKAKAIQVLTLNTIAFTVCFACWMTNGVLVTFLVDNSIYAWDKAQMGWLIGIPVLSGALFRLPVGILTDKYGGRIVYTVVMFIAVVPMFFLSFADSFWTFFAASLGFGIAGTSFAVGIAYSSVWFKKERQGTALGIFGAGNAGAALTSMGAPVLLAWLTNDGENLDAWRMMPKIYAGGLLLMAVVFWFLTYSKKVDDSHITTLWQRLEPLKHMRVWRFGLYYFLVFGGFVALAQWLIPYFVNVYGMTVAAAGMMAAIFSLPSGVIRALGGWMSDKSGARRIMYMVLGSILISTVLLIVPRMDIESPGKGIMSRRAGTVTVVTDSTVAVDGTVYKLRSINGQTLSEEQRNAETLIWPTSRWWQEPVVEVGDNVKKRELIVRGVTHIYFQANVWVFTILVFVIGTMMGIGSAAVYKHIPDYFPNDVGVVGGIVGVLGGLGGFFCPILFGYLLEGTGLWTTCWMFFVVLTAGCLWWMHTTIQKMQRKAMPQIASKIDRDN
jgi:NNP family nitrate/nitrite transporter-like MFS transporter